MLLVELEGWEEQAAEVANSHLAAQATVAGAAAPGVLAVRAAVAWGMEARMEVVGEVERTAAVAI